MAAAKPSMPARMALATAKAAGWWCSSACADALADGNRILAVIRGSAINQDGASSGLTAPNGPSQEAVIRAALANAGIRPAGVGYVEAHGTGTSLGDPIEVEALGNVLKQDRPADRPFYLGSVKTNVGHLEAGAGVAGLIKAVLMVQHGEIPPHLNFKTPNPLIAWDEIPAVIPTRLTALARGLRAPHCRGERLRLQRHQCPYRAGAATRISQPSSAGRCTGKERPLHILTLSAKNETALHELAERYQKVRATAMPRFTSTPDLAYTANTGRAKLPASPGRSWQQISPRHSKNWLLSCRARNYPA